MEKLSGRAWCNRLLKRFWLDEVGVAATEFALVVPVGLVLLYGALESGNAILLGRKVTTAGQVVADLVAQDDETDDSILADIVTAAANTVRPYDSDSLTVVVASITLNSDDVLETEWIFPEGSTSPLDSADDFPDDLVASSSESVIVAGVTYPYTPTLANFVFPAFTMEDYAFLRPRNGTKVIKTD